MKNFLRVSLATLVASFTLAAGAAQFTWTPQKMLGPTVSSFLLTNSVTVLNIFDTGYGTNVPAQIYTNTLGTKVTVGNGDVTPYFQDFRMWANPDGSVPTNVTVVIGIKPYNTVTGAVSIVLCPILRGPLNGSSSYPATDSAQARLVDTATTTTITASFEAGNTTAINTTKTITLPTGVKGLAVKSATCTTSLASAWVTEFDIVGWVPTGP